MAQNKLLDVRQLAGKKIKLNDYTHIKAYHACRAENEQSFRTQGLKLYLSISVGLTKRCCF